MININSTYNNGSDLSESIYPKLVKEEEVNDRLYEYYKSEYVRLNKLQREKRMK